MTISENVQPSISPPNIFRLPAHIRRYFLAPPPAPARIRAAVENYECESERIIGWFQLAGVAFFLALYGATYKAFAIHHAFEPVPVALSVYGAITLWRLRLSYRGRLARWQRYASAALDIGVLMALIAAFPSQYGEPAALYLKGPTLSYVYLLIALRALRFDPALVFFTGGAAATGWFVLALNAAINGAPLTSDYRVYMTSLSLLPGAELEKIGAILGCAGVLALGVGRARSLLFRTATEEIAAEDLSKFVGREAADLIRSSRDGVRAGEGALRRTAILFIDLRGFTPATRGLKPHLVIGLLQEYQSRLLPVIERGGGSVDKFLGDGILVSFGAARVSDHECASAVRTALAVAEEAKLWAAERKSCGALGLDIGIALASGDVVYGAVGHGDRLEYTVIGDAVNLAAKLEKYAKIVRAKVIITAETLIRAEAQGFAPAVLRRLDSAIVDGFGAPIDLAVLA